MPTKNEIVINKQGVGQYLGTLKVEVEGLVLMGFNDHVLPAHVRLAVRLLKTSIISVESSEIDLSDFQEEGDIDVPENLMAMQLLKPVELGPTENAAGGTVAETRPKKKMVITEEHFQKVTQALIMRLQQHEEEQQKEGSGLAGMRQKDLLVWYVDRQNAQQAYKNMDEVKEDIKCIKAIIEGAPHSLSKLMSDEWTKPYSREYAAYPTPWLRPSKFWPATGRVDNVYGDRNLVCTLLSLSQMAEEQAAANA